MKYAGRDALSRIAPRLVAIAALTCHAALGCATPPPPEGYEDLLRETRLNRKDARNVRFYRALDRSLERELPRLVRRCRIAIPQGGSANLLYRLNADGHVVESVIHPPNDFAMCVHTGLDVYPYPAPPEPDFWIGFRVPDCPLGGGFDGCADPNP